MGPVQLAARGVPASPPAAPHAFGHLLRARLAGIATLSPEGVVRSREGDLSAWLPEVGRSCFESPFLAGYDEELRTLRLANQPSEPLVLAGVRLADRPGSPRCHILITWHEDADEHVALTMVDQVDRPIDHWVRQQKREQRLLEERLILASRELERVNEDLRQFTSIAAHDLQAPLRQIGAFSALLRASLGANLSGQASDCLATIEACAGRLTHMITGLLDHARLSAGQFRFEAVDLNGVVAEACGNLGTQIEAGAAVIDVGTLPTVTGSSVLLVNLFQNLIANSLRYRAAERVPHVAVAALVGPEGESRIVVSDNGIGVPAPYAEAIFGSFVRVPRRQGAGGGVGLGLGICRRIAELHGWRLGLDTSCLVGARFHLDIRPPETRNPTAGLPQDHR